MKIEAALNIRGEACMSVIRDMLYKWKVLSRGGSPGTSGAAHCHIYTSGENSEIHRVTFTGDFQAVLSLL